MPPERLAQIQKEMDQIAEEFQKWTEIDLPLAPIPLAGIAEMIHQHCMGHMARYLEKGDEEAANAEPISALLNAMSFGMYLGRLGYNEASFTSAISLELSEEDERRLLSAGDTDKDTGGAAPSGL